MIKTAAVLAAFTTLATSAMSATAHAGAAATASSSPYWVQSHHAFTLALTGESQMCVPEFSHQEAALGAGAWQVYTAPIPYCAPGAVCPLLRIAPQLAGALEVKGSALNTLAPAREAHRAVVTGGRAGFRSPGFRADWRGVPRDAAGRQAAGPRGALESNMPGGKP